MHFNNANRAPVLSRVIYHKSLFPRSLVLFAQHSARAATGCPLNRHKLDIKVNFRAPAVILNGLLLGDQKKKKKKKGTLCSSCVLIRKRYRRILYVCVAGCNQWSNIYRGLVSCHFNEGVTDKLVYKWVACFAYSLVRLAKDSILEVCAVCCPWC